MRKSLAIIIAAATLLVLAACNRHLVYDKFMHTPVAGWEKNDTLLFEVPPVSQASTYQSRLELRVVDDYPFVSITLIVERHIYPRNEVRLDTLNCPLTDRRGNAAGKGISYHQYCFPINTMTLVPGDSLQISVRHDMKREILPGVSDVGIKIEKADRVFPIAKH